LLSFIQRACKDKSADIVAELLKAPGIAINGYQANTLPPLLLAALREDKEKDKIVNLIMNHTKDGDSPLHLACIQGNVEIIKKLLNKEARTTTKNNLKQTPLAAGYLQNPHFEDLYSAELNKLLSHDKKGNTQLHWAALLDEGKNDQLDNYIAFLLKNGLSLWKRNKRKELAVDVAYQKCNLLYNRYMRKNHYLHSKKTSKLLYMMTLNGKLAQKEMVLHSFLRFTSIQTQCALFKCILQPDEKEPYYIPRELQIYIAHMYYALNIETIIAKKYKHQPAAYYYGWVAYKDEIKKKLLKNPEPHLLWSAS